VAASISRRPYRVIDSRFGGTGSFRSSKTFNQWRYFIAETPSPAMSFLILVTSATSTMKESRTSSV
jgi:hypothetical protein